MVAEFEPPEGTPRFRLTATPDRATVAGLLAALSEIVRLPVRLPATVGAKLTWIWHEVAGAKELPQLFV